MCYRIIIIFFYLFALCRTPLECTLDQLCLSICAFFFVSLRFCVFVLLLFCIFLLLWMWFYSYIDTGLSDAEFNIRILVVNRISDDTFNTLKKKLLKYIRVKRFLWFSILNTRTRCTRVYLYTCYIDLQLLLLLDLCASNTL